MKHVVIIHGWKGKPESNWKPWLASELEKHGFNVDVPAMPSPEIPLPSEWIKTIAQTVGPPTLDTYLVGHSLGCIAILRYLETLTASEVIGAVFMLAGFGRRFKGYRGQHDSFFDHELDWQQIRQHCRQFISISSDNDPYIKQEEGEFLREKLHADGLLLHGMGHFGSDDGVFELPAIRDKILSL